MFKYSLNISQRMRMHEGKTESVFKLLTVVILPKLNE